MVTNTVKDENSKIIFIWHPGRMVDKIKVYQVYGFCLNKDGKVVLVRDKDETRFTLPGGHVDNGEEAITALKREFEEEAQFTPTNIELLGSLEVTVKDLTSKIIEHHQQVRFVCFINDPGTFIPEKNGWETVDRIFVRPEELPKYLEWMAQPTGKAQLDDLRIFRGLK